MAKAKKHKARAFATCSVDGCALDANRIGAGLCEKHYTRQRRRSSVNLAIEDSPPCKLAEHSHGYVLEYAPDHPLSGRSTMSRVYQHRRVFYDHNGEGPFLCHWCGTSLSWDEMHVDHVNAVRHDNRIENLVASCPPCNKDRARAKIKATLRQRSKARIEWRGESLTMTEWSERTGISRSAIKWRLDHGWPIEKVLTEPRGKTGPQRRGQ